MNVNWYALQTKAQKEDVVTQQLEARGFPVFYPRLHVQPVNPRSRTYRPFFPCYVFVRADLAQVGLSLFQHLPHAVGLVCFGSEPAEVTEDLLHAIDARLDEINAAGGETFFRLQQGDTVVIEHGPFAGYEAIFDARLRDTDRVRVLLELLGQRQVVLNLAVGQIRLK
jgi:transcriptional antiterminator RfaH